MRKQTIRFALWLARLAGWVPPQGLPFDVPAPLEARARVLVAEQTERYAGLSEYKWSVSGESRRHQVYARLVKEFPDVRRRVISLAIELSLGD